MVQQLGITKNICICELRYGLQADLVIGSGFFTHLFICAHIVWAISLPTGSVYKPLI
jgi:hypothetical protein